jgi:hypothetical protein
LHIEKNYENLKTGRGQTPKPNQCSLSLPYWDVFEGIAEDKSYILYEFAVNVGIKKATKIVQVVAGAVPDGIIGPITTVLFLKLIFQSNCCKKQFLMGRILSCCWFSF